jgi:Zn/Cd-binding protein ZinT
MNPQDLIAAFLEVWQSNPDNIWQNSGAIQGLEKLNNSLVVCQDKSDSELANELGQWCSSYPQLTQKVMDKLGEKKLRGSDNDSPNTNDTAYENLYPKITEILRNRAPIMGKKENQS